MNLPLFSQFPDPPPSLPEEPWDRSESESWDGPDGSPGREGGTVLFYCLPRRLGARRLSATRH